jgi:hypothetical protein
MNFQQQLLDHLDASAEARVVHDQGKGQNALVVLRQFHGSKYHAIDIECDEKFRHLFIEHQNNIRMFCRQIMCEFSDSHLLVEGYQQIHNQPLASVATEYLQEVADHERQLCGTPDPLSLRIPLDTPFPVISPDTSTLDLDDWVKMSDRYPLEFVSYHIDRILGSLRQAAELVLNNQVSRVHGIEPNEWKATDLQRVESIVRVFRKSVGDEGLGILVMGAAHTKSGVKAEGPIKHHYFEEILPHLLPDTRLIVVEPKVIVWDYEEEINNSKRAAWKKEYGDNPPSASSFFF